MGKRQEFRTSYWRKKCLCGFVFLICTMLSGCGKDKALGTENKSPVPPFLSTQLTTQGLDVEIAYHNLLTEKKVKLTADTEDKNNPVKYVMDGDKETYWTSENNWDNPEHFLQVSFKNENQIQAMRILWERDNVRAYAIEVSSDDVNWTEVFAFSGKPEKTEQKIFLDSPAAAKSVRIHVTEVSKEEENTDLYYQNVGIRELEIYDAQTEHFTITPSMLKAGTNREIPIPKVPEGYALSVAGIDYENLLIGECFADTLSDVNIELGYKLTSDNGWSKELPGFSMVLPASETAQNTDFPFEDIPVKEWKATEGMVAANIFLALKPVEEINDDVVKYLGNEGYEIEISFSEVMLKAGTAQGMCFAKVTYDKMVEEAAGEGIDIPCGILRDYPKYAVRGFNIDVGRRPISLDFLQKVILAMEKEKMNTLQIHLNDNVILTNYDAGENMEKARELYSGFRLESEIRNKAGKSITSEDFFYTKEKFAELAAFGKEHGVEVVPELDTPAHSLALVSVFPEYGFRGKDWRLADELDVSNVEVIDFAESIWKEYLADTFAECAAVHLGMDEYFGDAKDYENYLKTMIGRITALAPEKELCVWASTERLGTDRSVLPKDVAMMVWSSMWDNPETLHEEGFSTINCLNSHLYIIPGAGENDFLDMEYLQKEWEPNRYFDDMTDVTLPAYSERVKGAVYSMWNDSYVPGGDNLSEEELFKRFEDPLSVLAEKLW